MNSNKKAQTRNPFTPPRCSNAICAFALLKRRNNMKKELNEQCEDVLKQLREMDKQNKSGSNTMEFEDGHEDLTVDFVMHAWERYTEWELEMHNEEVARIAEAEADYQEQFAVDGRNWSEV